MPDVHARLSASGAHKWLYAPPTLWMEEGLPDFTSPYAEEGTAAHSLVELKLKYATDQITKRTFTRRLNKFKEDSDWYSKSMDEYTDQHVDLVLEALNERPNAVLFSEQRVDYGKWAPGGFGTADTLIVDDGLLDIWDFKYGKGQLVRANYNVQMMLYALGAVAEYSLIYEFDKVRMTISQLRLGNLDTFEISLPELLAWGDDVVKIAADHAINGDGPRDWDNPQTWQFYKAMGFDKSLAEYNLKIRKYKFKEANTLKPEEIEDILDQAPRIRKWLDAVEAYATKQLFDGHEIPGYKLVEGRSNRVITDKEKAAAILEKAGYEDIYRPKDLRTLTQLEKTVGKAEFSELLGDLIDKPTGKPALVTEDDKRPALNSIAQAIKDFEED
ncbi:DUF2800 domain-containing protein [Agrilactobacillus fermenti]|uniref:DUF2800 domain-containing protein n=1 Tax=Agrilactobacillus fermenti TaxID=2586909 RepID=UPI003A5C1C09